MIVRISGEGQRRLPDDAIDDLNRLDDALEAALNGEGDFSVALAALIDAVRLAGEPVADDELVESDVILPASDATEEEVRELLGQDGLLPG